MNEIDNGGPAFPAPAGLSHITSQGISLRDYFAGLAMKGIILTTGFTIEQRAGWAYRQADAMLKAREGK